MGDYISRDRLLNFLAGLYGTATEEQEQIILKIAEWANYTARFVEKVNE